MVGFKPQRIRRGEGHDGGVGERKLGCFPAPKPPAELPLPDPIVPSKSANLSFQLPNFTPFRPGLPQSPSASKCCVRPILGPKHISLSYSLNMLFWGVSGVPNPMRVHGLLKKGCKRIRTCSHRLGWGVMDKQVNT